MCPSARKGSGSFATTAAFLDCKRRNEEIGGINSHMLDSDFRYAIEVRHKSLFDKGIYKLLSDNNICLAWSQLDTIQTPHEQSSDFLYLRFIGDRSIDQKDFGTIQKDHFKELKMWSDEVSTLNDRANFAIVAANNQYAGFGPANANSFRKMMGLKEVVWEEMKQKKRL